ncbi:MAG: alkylation response protein AidB-like acyl-CoA dehydrogenase [Bacteroidia bacterium]|jgi:alkylation response protein AidB-like acyl-CoA dehydrogenase
MNYFTEEHNQFRQSLRDFLQKEVVPFVDEWEKVGNPPRDIWKKFGDMGYFGLRFPEKYGGLSLDFFYDVILLEELAKINSAGTSAAIGAHTYLSLAHLNNEGSEEQKQKYLVPGIAGEIFGCLAISEPGGGSDVASMRTTAVKDGDDWIINGSKTFITNGVLSDYLIISAKTEPELKQAGISMFVVDRNTVGLSATKLDKLGWRASDTAEMAFADMRVPADALLGEENQGFYYIMQQFALERLIMAIGGVAGSEYALQYGLDYMREREAFGRPLTKFQELRHRIAQLAAEIEQQKQFVYYLCDRFTKGEYIVKEAAMAKLLATQLSDKVTFEVVQFLGGYGYMEDYQASRMWRDSRLGQIGGGTSEIMKEIIAKMAIDEVKYS